MPSYEDRPDLAVAAAVELRARLRALAVAQSEAFQLLYQDLGGSNPAGLAARQMSDRLPFLAFLLADLAWTHGDHSAHEAPPPERAAEAEAVCRVFRHHDSERRRYPLSHEQRTAVLAYLDAVLAEVSRCLELEGLAPSGRLGREARQLVVAVTDMRRAAELQ